MKSQKRIVRLADVFGDLLRMPNISPSQCSHVVCANNSETTFAHFNPSVHVRLEIQLERRARSFGAFQLSIRAKSFD
jgi:hypothetical protein